MIFRLTKKGKFGSYTVKFIADVILRWHVGGRFPTWNECCRFIKGFDPYAIPWREVFRNGALAGRILEKFFAVRPIKEEPPRAKKGRKVG